MESVRLEEERATSGVRLTTILPSSINTPLFDHALSTMGMRPAPLPPVYQPEASAQVIAFAATHPRRDIYVGAAARQLDLLDRLSPALTDRQLTAAAAPAEDAAPVAAPDPSDTRFRDPAWQRDPFFRMLGQGYLRWAQMMTELADAAAPEGPVGERATKAASAAQDVSDAGRLGPGRHGRCRSGRRPDHPDGEERPREVRPASELGRGVRELP